jgi:hypothetical protein
MTGMKDKFIQERKTKMQVEEIALRQEIRQMLNEAGINRTSLREMADSILREEIAKQVKNSLNQNNINMIARSTINAYELKDSLREAIRKEISSAMNISIDVKTTVTEHEENQCIDKTEPAYKKEDIRL